MSSLERAIVRSKFTRSREAKDRSQNDDPRPPHIWKKAMEDLRAGTFKTRLLRYPVIIAPGSPVSSAEKLQQLAELDSLPEIMETKQIEEDGTQRRVIISSINPKEKRKMEEKADVLTDGPIVWFRDTKRFALVVKSLKQAWRWRRETRVGRTSGSEGTHSHSGLPSSTG
ncbi:hypothetical protein VTK56DRAFT_3094 [Thermocarpiscus australiensis]